MRPINKKNNRDKNGLTSFSGNFSEQKEVVTNCRQKSYYKRAQKLSQKSEENMSKIKQN